MREVIGITAPHRTSILASVEPARVRAVVVAEGSFVEQGELVVQLEDDVQAARTRIAQASAENSLAVELARVLWMRADRDLQRLTKLSGDDFSSSKELNDAASDAEAARLEYELAMFNQQQAQLALARETELLQELRIAAPYSGYVAEHLKRPGETVDQLEGIVRLVQLDPITVIVDCPVGWAAELRAGERLRVRPVDERWPPREGEIALVSKVADAGSQTLKLKLTVPNKDADWLAGLKVAVELPATPHEAAGPRPGSNQQAAPRRSGDSYVRH